MKCIPPAAKAQWNEGDSIPFWMLMPRTQPLALSPSAQHPGSHVSLVSCLVPGALHLMHHSCPARACQSPSMWNQSCSQLAQKDTGHRRGQGFS